jgi:hypothetical protein
LLDEVFDHVLAEYGGRGYQFWSELIGDQINFMYPNDRGKQIEIMPVWARVREKGGKILVVVAIVGVSFWKEPTKCFLVNVDGSIEMCTAQSRSSATQPAL